MKKVIFMLVALIVVGTCAIAYSAPDTRHNYFNGIVEYIGPSTLTVSGSQFTLAQKVDVIIQVNNKGVFQTSPGKLGDISKGNSVTVKESGNVVVEITIERWKR
ncbi:MAG: pilus assembly protein PilL [Thermodesulfovibrionales bacterium]